MKTLLFLLGLFCLSPPLLATNAPANEPSPAITKYEYQILAQRTHKPQLFTQGLILHDKVFYESSGLYGQSKLVSYPLAEPETKWAKMIAPFSQQINLPKHYFAEGLTLFENQLYLLTWQEGTVLVYDKNTLALKTRFHYKGEGWGLAHDGTSLIRSDGSPTLYFHNPQNFSVNHTIQVTEEQRAVHRINELEFIDKTLWANIWHANRLIQIDPKTGNVIGSLDLSSLVAKVKVNTSESVLNGIAYDEDQQALWVTGKSWPVMYLIRVIKSDKNT